MIFAGIKLLVFSISSVILSRAQPTLGELMMTNSQGDAWRALFKSDEFPWA